MVAFYTQGDQDIYEEGEHFIPQEYYRLNKFNNTVAPVPPEAPQSFGITNTNAFTGGGGGGGGLNDYGLDESNTKMFDKQVWGTTKPGGEKGWYTTQVEGFYHPNTGQYRTDKGKNIEHGGIDIAPIFASLFGFAKTGRKEGDIKGTFSKDYKTDEEKKYEQGIYDAAIHRSRMNKIKAMEAQGINFMGDVAKSGIHPDDPTPTQKIIPQDHGQGAASQETQRSYEDAGGSYTGEGEDPDWGGGEKEGGFIDGSNRRIGFKKGGRQDQMGGTMEQTAQELREAAPDQFGGGMTIGHGGDGPTTGGDNTAVIPKKNYIDIEPDLVRKDPFVNLNLTSPLQIAKLKARLGYTNLFDNDDLSLEGKFSTDLGNFRTETDFTEGGFGDTSINYNNLSALIDANKNIKNIGYNNTWDGINYGINTNLDNTMLTAGISFNNGGLVGLL